MISTMKSIVQSMQLQCTRGCKHEFCSKSLEDLTFQKGERIEVTQTSKIYKCQESKSDRLFICKVKEFLDERKYIESLVNETHLNHKNIVKYFGSVEIKNKQHIFLEYVNGCTLHDKIRKIKPDVLPETDIRNYTKQILEGLSFLHTNKVIHRDLKPSKIMLSTDNIVKICGLGMSRVVDTTLSGNARTDNLTRCGTYNYMAPEVINDEDYYYPVDIWSLGAAITEMVTGLPPFHGFTQTKLIIEISFKKKIPFEPPETMKDDFKDLLKRMLSETPKERPSALEILTTFKF